MTLMGRGRPNDDAIRSTKIWDCYAVCLGQITCEIDTYAWDKMSWIMIASVFLFSISFSFSTFTSVYFGIK